MPYPVHGTGHGYFGPHDSHVVQHYPTEAHHFGDAYHPSYGLPHTAAPHDLHHSPMHEAAHFDAYQTHHDDYEPHGHDHTTFFNVHADAHPLPAHLDDHPVHDAPHDMHFADSWL